MVVEYKTQVELIDPEVRKSPVKDYYLIGHALAVLFSGVDQRLVQVHHQDQLFVPVESLLVFSAQLLCLLSERINEEVK